MSNEKRLVKVALPLDLVELLEEEAKDYDSFTKMMQAICRRHFLNKHLREEFAKLEKQSCDHI